MPIQTLNIPGLPEPQGYVHIAIASGSRVVLLAGQVAQDWDESKLEQLLAGFGRAAERLGAAARPATLIPVPRLFEPGHLIEVEVTAVLP